MSYGYDAYAPIEYAQPHPDFNFTIHLNSAAAQLGLTPEELAPILQEQQEFLDSLDSLGYEPKQQWYEHPPTRHTQPPFELDIHPNSMAAQLGLTLEEVREVNEEQERWFREEYQQELERDRT